MDISVVGPDFQRSQVSCFGLGKALHFLEQNAQVVVDIGIVGIFVQCPMPIIFGIFQSPKAMGASSGDIQCHFTAGSPLKHPRYYRQSLMWLSR